MDRKHEELWQRIENLAIDDDGVQLTFVDRLARENGWSREFARRVVAEYKRFVFMAMVAEHEVTPSDAVDEAWHLHLTYTRSYWNDLCRNVLGRPLHHIPTRGGKSETSRHLDQYRQTLATYQEHFGEAAPADIWPAAEERFAGAKHVRVNRAEAWIIPKPRWPRGLVREGTIVTTALAAPVVMGIANPFDMTGPEFLRFYGIICAMAIPVAIALRHFLRQDEPLTDERPLTPYEVACLGGGVPGVLRACLATLVLDKRLMLTTGEKYPQFEATVPPESGQHEIERVMLRQASHENGATTPELLAAARTAGEQIQDSLRARGLMESQESFAAARWGPLLILVPVLLLGLVKVAVGIFRDKPVVILIFWVIALALLIAYFCTVPLRTRRGQAKLRELKSQHDRLRSLDLGSATREPMMPVASNDLLLAAGLFGLASLNHPDVTALNKSLRPISTNNQTNSCGASTGCSSGGCGGGGGGCGGGCGGCGGD
jgi:uncharacterized protein (TIGR04222 family)